MGRQAIKFTLELISKEARDAHKFIDTKVVELSSVKKLN